MSVLHFGFLLLLIEGVVSSSCLEEANERILKDLAHPLPDIRARATLKIKRLGVKAKVAFDALIVVAFQDKSKRVRAIATDVLYNLESAPYPEMLTILRSVSGQHLRKRLLSFLFLVPAEFDTSEREQRRLFVPALISLLNDSDPETRDLTVGALGSIRDERAINPLVGLIRREPNETVKTHGAWALAHFKSAGKDAVPILLRTIRKNKENGEILEGSFDSLENIGKDSVPALLELMREKETDTRRRSATLLESLANKGWITGQPLLGYLSDSDVEVRLSIVRALREMRSPSITVALEKILENDIPVCQIAAADAILEVSPESTRPIQVMVNILARDNAIRNRAAALIGLAKAGRQARSAYEFVETYLRDPRLQPLAVRALYAIDPTKRTKVVNALTKILNTGELELKIVTLRTLSGLGKDSRLALPSLVLLVGDTETARVRIAASRALGKLGVASSAVISALGTAVRSGNADVCLEAAASLTRLNCLTQEGVMALINLILTHEAGEVRVCAIGVLERAGGRARVAKPLLLERVKTDPELIVRLAALRALRTIGSEDSRVIDVLKDALKNPNEIVAQLGAELLRSVGVRAQRATSALAAALKSKDNAVRLGAARALAAIGPEAKEAALALEDALLDEDSFVRSAAEVALDVIAKPPKKPRVP